MSATLDWIGMPLESGTYISDLVSTNPAAADSVGQADDHLRFIKATLLATFTGITGAVTATHTQLNAAVAAVVTGLAQAVHIAGTVGAPGIAFLGSLTSGLYSPAANQVAITANGVQALLATASGVTVPGALATTGAYSGGTGQLGIIGEPRLWLSNTLPSGSFAWLNGGTLNRVANPVLFALWGTTYGVGDGSTTFNVPNFQDVVPIGRGTMGGASDPGLVAGATTIGTVIGAGTHTLLQAALPAIKPAITITDPGHIHGISAGNTAGPGSIVSLGSNFGGTPSTASATTGITAALTSNLGSATPFSVVQPAIVCNWITLIG